MRPGSHHLINNLISGKPTEGFVAGRGSCDVLTTTATTQGDGRIISLFGHRDSHTECFAASPTRGA